ncbi:MAG TPA: VOC family protein [Bradyrhizobium sp.]|jgi:PhnB protein|nr:VOC family protein [Bradyrhizobium sp.]
MQVDPYLHYDGNCEAAFKFYEKELGAKVEAIMRYADAPPDMPTTPESKNKVMHGRISIDGAVVMGSDSPPGHFQKPQGFSLTLTVDDPAEAERKFNTLCKGGAVHMPWAKTFFAKGFGMGVDQFGIPWMVISPMEH